MSLRECALLFSQLGSNPESRYTAAEQGWQRPVSYEWLILADLYDLQRATTSKRRSRPYPRPTSKRTKLGGANNKRRSITDVRRILRPHRESSPD